MDRNLLERGGIDVEEALARVEIYLLELAAAVAHLHDGHAAAVPVEQLGLRLFENGLRQLRRAGREIVNSVRHLRTLP